jgi:hypothetical protein
LAFLFLSFASQVFAGEPINTLEKTGIFSFKPFGIAIRGADTVAYFTVGKSVQGTDDFTTGWSGATWKFASQKHLDLFIARPENMRLSTEAIVHMVSHKTT